VHERVHQLPQRQRQRLRRHQLVARLRAGAPRLTSRSVQLPAALQARGHVVRCGPVRAGGAGRQRRRCYTAWPGPVRRKQAAARRAGRACTSAASSCVTSRWCGCR